MEVVSAVVRPQPKDDDLWEQVPCNLCGSWDVQVKYEGTTDQDMEKMLQSYSASGNFVSKETLVQCKHCGLVYTSPRLRQDLILQSYTDAEDPLYVSQAEGRIRSFGRCLDAVSKYTRPGRVLDVGAASGFFLKVAKDRGWETYGVEPSRYLSEYGNRNYGVNIFCGTLERAPKFEKKMDLVTLWDVLEHTFDPKDVLTRCNRYLRNGGLIVINYPNIGNWLARLAGKRYWFILSVHLYYFVPKTIARILEETGFEMVEEAPHYQWLELGYLIYRLEAYVPPAARAIRLFSRLLGMEKMLVPYFAAQTRVVARKVKNI
ncbi:MAG: class I SAM-dependent methyltransferase [Deltaproteobacteria bacterium]|nr:class I SAM-dependent methyltransferase [Deltaproteobacteria bacterium]